MLITNFVFLWLLTDVMLMLCNNLYLDIILLYCDINRFNLVNKLEIKVQILDELIFRIWYNEWWSGYEY